MNKNKRVTQTVNIFHTLKTSLVDQDLHVATDSIYNIYCQTSAREIQIACMPKVVFSASSNIKPDIAKEMDMQWVQGVSAAGRKEF